LTYFAWMSWPSLKTKALTSGAFVSVTGIVGFDRIYLNVHWATDVIGAVLLGTFWLLLCILVFSYLQVRYNEHSVSKKSGLVRRGNSLMQSYRASDGTCQQSASRAESFAL
jgi:hypothetical protein